MTRVALNGREFLARAVSRDAPQKIGIDPQKTVIWGLLIAAFPSAQSAAIIWRNY